MKRIALIVACFALMLAISAGADEATIRFSHQNAATMQALLQGDLPEWQVRAFGGAVELPEGVEQIEAIMEQNAIRAVGTEEGIARLSDALKDLDKPVPQIEIVTTWLELNDPSVLGYALAVDEERVEIAAPEIAVFTDMSDEEIAALNDAGTVLSEPHIVTYAGRPGQMAFAQDTDDDGAEDVGQGLGCAAWVLPSGAVSVQVDFWSYDTRPEAQEAETSLRTMLRVADGETVLLARIGEDGAILNPVYLLTARVVEQ
jgi:hypothetical protein